MSTISITAVGKIIEGALDNDIDKVRSYADFIAQTLKADGDILGYKIICSKLDGSYKTENKITCVDGGNYDK